MRATRLLTPQELASSKSKWRSTPSGDDAGLLVAGHRPGQGWRRMLTMAKVKPTSAPKIANKMAPLPVAARRKRWFARHTHLLACRGLRALLLCKNQRCYFFGEKVSNG